MDLDFPLIGQKERPVLAEAVRPLTEADVAMLATERSIQPSAIKRLTAGHHSLARCLALGMKDVEAAAITGYTPSRISVLRDSPLFAELIAHYTSQADSAVADVQKQLLDLALTGINEIQQRLEDEPEKISTGIVNEITKSALDRAGFGPQSKTTNLNVNVSLAERVAEGRRRAEMSARPPAVEVLGPEKGSLPQPSLALKSEDVA